MANINAALPTSIAVPFHPPTEALQQDNLIKPVIPKTEVIGAYAKLRGEEGHTPFSDQSRSIIQDESEQNNPSAEQQQQQSNAESRRLKLFSNNSDTERDSEEKVLQVMINFKLAISVIQEKYNRAVTPIPEANINYFL